MPTAPVSVAVALADKLDTLILFFLIREMPTGSRDPYALRRAALGVLALVISNSIRLKFLTVIAAHLDQISSDLSVIFSTYGNLVLNQQFAEDQVRKLVESQRSNVAGEWVLPEEVSVKFEERDMSKARRILDTAGDIFVAIDKNVDCSDDIMRFFADRLKVQQREAGVRHDLIDAVFALGGEDDLVRLLARVKALQAFVATDDGANLLASHKRAANILTIEAKKDDPSPGSAAPSPTSPSRGEVKPAESALAAALDAALPAAAAAVVAEEFGAAMTALAGLRAPVDRFFADVMVNDPDPAVRADRLALLGRFRDAVHAVADFSKVEG